MKSGARRKRAITMTAALLIVIAAVGAIGTWVVGTFVMEKYDAYGEVEIPGSGRLHLPAGEATISFHTRIIGTTNGMGLPVPPLELSITPPPGVAQPEVSERIGSTTTVNNDARVRVWVMRVAAEGDYTITTGGKVSAFINPRLAFGYANSLSRWLWGFAAVGFLGVLTVVLTAAGTGLRRRIGSTGSTIRQPAAAESPAGQTFGHSPTAEAIRLEQLKTITKLRDCGALTQAEFDAEKRRILEDR